MRNTGGGAVGGYAPTCARLWGERRRSGEGGQLERWRGFGGKGEVAHILLKLPVNAGPNRFVIRQEPQYGRVQVREHCIDLENERDREVGVGTD